MAFARQSGSRAADKDEEVDRADDDEASPSSSVPFAAAAGTRRPPLLLFLLLRRKRDSRGPRWSACDVEENMLESAASFRLFCFFSDKKSGLVFIHFFFGFDF